MLSWEMQTMINMYDKYQYTITITHFKIDDENVTCKSYTFWQVGELPIQTESKHI